MLENISIQVESGIYRETYKGWKIPPRKIKNHELVFIISGEGNIMIDGKNYKCKKNDLIYFYPDKLHSLSVSKPPHMIFYAFHFETGFNEKLPIPDISNIENHYKLSEYFRQLYKTSVKKDYMYKWQLSIFAQNILYEIFWQSNANIAPMNLVRINKVLEYIHKNSCEKFSIEDLTKAAEMKKSYFIKMFKTVTGKSPIKYINDLKLEHARDLLLNTDMSVKKIALKCGFEDEFYFSRIFKRHYGVSPSKIL